MVAKVLLDIQNIKMNKVFDYLIPDELKKDAEIGKRILANFGKGKGREEEGIIVAIEEEYTGKYKLKSIISILDEVPVVTKKQLSFAKKMSKIYFCNVYEFLKLFFPPGTTSKFSNKDYSGKKVSMASLIKTEEEIQDDIESEKITSPKHIRVLKFMINNGYEILTSELMEGLSVSRSIIGTLEKNGYIRITKVELENEKIDNINIEKTIPLELTSYQKKVYDEVCFAIDEEKYKSFLIRGITGSGKTEIYMQAIEKVIENGKTAIMLVPEIALTHQMTTNFLSRFGDNIAVLHSKMTLSNRKKEWKRINEGSVKIVIGARSALFAPLKNVGLIIIDEEHDTSYKSQSVPRYSAKEVANYLCQEQNSILILGSASPEISTYYEATNGKYNLLEMLERPGSAVLPEVKIIDQREEYAKGNLEMFSKCLIEEIEKRIKLNEQTMLFINRRGHSSYILCSSCGEILKCKNCDVALTYHKNVNLNICHYCGYVEKEGILCPSCGKDTLIKSGMGTEKVEEELKLKIPGITTLRMDLDSTLGKDGHKKILDDFKNNNINVLIGTQMISKGHDISNVTLVGILNVDNMLAINDYLASERAFSNIMQVAGRAGRSQKKGEVIIQSFNSEHYVLQAALTHDYLSFYNQEINFRKMFEYPPFKDIIFFEVTSKEFNKLKIDTNKLHDILLKINTEGYKVYNPKSPYIQKINNKYRINIIAKCYFDEDIVKLISKVLQMFDSVKSKNTNVSVTRNPIFM